MKPIRFGKPKLTPAQRKATDQYWKVLVKGEPVPPGPPPGAYVPPKASKEAA